LVVARGDPTARPATAKLSPGSSGGIASTGRVAIARARVAGASYSLYFHRRLLPRAKGMRRDSARRFRHERRTARSENQETAQPAGSAGELVMRSRIELEVEFNRHGATPGLDRYHLHTKCFAAWELERKKSGAD